MKTVIWLLVLLLVIIHQDVWNWESETLVFGFMPLTLFYHACISLAAGVVWFMACQFAWPEDETDYVSDNVSTEEATS